MALPEKHVPAEIGRANENDVKIIWDDGREDIHAARELRFACPCAQCVNELTGERMLKLEAVPADVRPLRIEIVGRYALRIEWSDGHSLGIYTFDSLYRRGQDAEIRRP